MTCRNSTFLIVYVSLFSAFSFFSLRSLRPKILTLIMTEQLQTIEIETKPKPSHSVIWLHGLGADGNDFVPIVQELTLPPVGIRFVFPHAPMRPVTINGGFVMRAWYDITGQDMARKE